MDTGGPDALVDLIGATAAQVDEMTLFRNLVQDWNARMNLVGPSFQDDFWQRHALDSAQLFHVEHRARRWADVGSGAGLPGVILAILLKGVPGAEVHLVESIAKRVQFLREACKQLDLPAVVHHGRAEALNPMPKVEVVTARACAPLDRLLDYTAGFFRLGARGAFLKGASVASEIAGARNRWRFDAALVPSQSDPTGRILRMSGVTRRG